jgi:hypothetical protein
MGRIDPLDGGYGLRNRRGKRPGKPDTEFLGHLAVRVFLFGIMSYGFYLGGEDLIRWLDGLSDSVRTMSASGPTVLPGR